MPARIRSWLLPQVCADGVAHFGGTGAGLVATGLSSSEVALLRRLDGSRSDATLCREAQSRGLEPHEWLALVERLRRLGLVEDLPGAAPAGDGTVLVASDDDLALEITGCLRAAGAVTRMGSVLADAALAEPVAPAWPTLVVTVGRPAGPGDPGVPVEDAQVWWSRGVPVLPVTVDRAGLPFLRVGPVLDPRGGPCLSCLARHLSEEHPNDLVSLPVAVPLPAPHQTPGRLPPPAWDGRAQDTAASGLAAICARMAAAAAALMALDRLDPSPVIASGVSVDVSGPLPRMDHRRWQVHPACSRHGGLPSMQATGA